MHAQFRMRSGPMGAEARAGRLTVRLGGEGRQGQQRQRDSRGRVVAGASSGSKLTVAHLVELGYVSGADL